MLTYYDEERNEYLSFAQCIAHSMDIPRVIDFTRINSEGITDIDISVDNMTMRDFYKYISFHAKEVHFYIKQGIVLGRNVHISLNGKDEYFYCDYGIFNDEFHYGDIVMDEKGNEYKVSFPMLSIYGNNPDMYNFKDILELKFKDCSYKNLEYDFINSFGHISCGMYSRLVKLRSGLIVVKGVGNGN